MYLIIIVHLPTVCNMTRTSICLEFRIKKETFIMEYRVLFFCFSVTPASINASSELLSGPIIGKIIDRICNKNPNVSKRTNCNGIYVLPFLRAYLANNCWLYDGWVETRP